MRSLRALLLLVPALITTTASAAEHLSIAGTVSADGAPMSGVFITALDSTRGISWSAKTDRSGKFSFAVEPGTYIVSGRQRGFRTTKVSLRAPAQHDFQLKRLGTDDPIPADYLLMLPDGDEKRRFAVDCLGCHSLNERIVLDKNGKPWDERGWSASTTKMLSFAGHTTRFPVMPPDRKPEATAAFLAKHITADRIQRARESIPPLDAPRIAYEVTEYDLPDQNDFPHDLMLDGRGNVLVTGMFSGLMYMLDPGSGKFKTVEIPVPQANPRALDVDAFGDWWILCGFPNKVARYRVKNGKWDVFDIGMYGHSVDVDTKQRAWFNGHFTRDPVRFGYVDLATRKTHTLEAPPTPMPAEQGSPIPYELRVGPDGNVWMTELAGNRLLRHDPATGETKAFTMPTPHCGPRRCDIGSDGMVWVPAFAAGRLVMFDPKTETFTKEYVGDFENSLPYCTRVDQRRGVVWTSLCAADAVTRLDLSSGQLDRLQLPTRNAFIRHLDVDAATGEVWGAYSHSPNLEMKIVRLRAFDLK